LRHIVLAALLICASTSPALSQKVSKNSDAEFKTLIDRYSSAWSSLNPDNAAPPLATTLSAAGLDNFYGVNMVACVPTGQTSAQSVLFNSGGDASFRDGGFGEIILTCAIPNTLSRITKMTVRYKDDGVRGAGSQVVTALRQRRYVFNGISEGVDSAPSTIAETDSNAFVPPVVSPQGYRDHQKNVLPTNGTLTFDHRQFFYYIQVNMRRPAGTTGPVTVAYVTLF